MKTSKFYHKLFLILFSITLSFVTHAQVDLKSNNLANEDCQPPKNLISELYLSGPGEAIINWESPYTVNQWLQYDNGINDGGLATESELWFAAKWETDQLPNNELTKIHSVQFFPKNSISSLFLLIWQGPNAESLIYEEEITTIEYDEWNTITLTNPVHIDANEELQVGFRMISSEEGAGVGEFTGNPNSDLFSFDGITWQRLADIDMSYSWNLSVHIFNDEMPTDFLGYNIYRDDSQINTELILNTSFIDFTPIDEWACYKATAEYSVCGESELSNEACITIMGLDDEMNTIAEIFPNPIQDQVKIKSKSSFNLIIIYNQQGQICFKKEITLTNETQLDLSELNNGIYFMELNSQLIKQKIKLIIRH